MEQILSILKDILNQPAILMGLVSFVGLIAMRKEWYKVLTGSISPILGYLMLGAGADVITANLAPLGAMIEQGFHIVGVVPNNEAVTATAQTLLGIETMTILVVGLISNLLIARFTKFKYVFLTGHHSFFMACLLSAVLGALGLSGWQLIAVGGFLLGAWSALSPAIGQQYTLKVTDGDDIAIGHFGSIGYYLSAWIGGIVGNPNDSTEDMKIPEQWGFLRNTTISTGLIMMVFYLVSAFVAGSDVVAEFAGTENMYVFAIMSALKFAVGVAIVYSGVRMILADLLPAFQGISTKLIPNAIPAVDCAVLFTYGQTAVIIGFVSSFIGGLIGMFILGALGGVLIIPGMVPHFFCGATAGIYGNATGGKRGAVIGSFVNGLALAFLPALLLPGLGALGFSNATFGDVDFAIIGLILSEIVKFIGINGIYALITILALVLIVPNFIKTKTNVINNHYEEEV